MMNKHDYQQAVNSIRISESFKSRTAQLMREERERNSAVNSVDISEKYVTVHEKPRFIPIIRYGGIVLTAIAVIAAISIYSDSRSPDIAEDTTASGSTQNEGAAAPAPTTVMIYSASDSGEYSETASADSFDYEVEVEDEADYAEEEAEDEADYSAGAGTASKEQTSAVTDSEFIIAEVPAEALPPTVQTTTVPLPDYLAANTDAKFAGNAECTQYLLADSNQKRPDDMNAEFAQIDEFPDDVIKTIAECENSENITDYVDPEEYAASSELYSSIGWNGYVLRLSFYTDNAAFYYTVCGNTITNNSSYTSYRLTPEQLAVFEQLAKDQLGVMLKIH